MCLYVTKLWNFFLMVLLLFDCFLFFLVPLLKPDRLPLCLYVLFGVFLASSLCAVFFFCFLSLSSPSFVLPDIVNTLNLLMQTLGPLKGLFEVSSKSSGPLFAADSLSAPVRTEYRFRILHASKVVVWKIFELDEYMILVLQEIIQNYYMFKIKFGKKSGEKGREQNIFLIHNIH